MLLKYVMHGECAIKKRWRYSLVKFDHKYLAVCININNLEQPNFIHFEVKVQALHDFDFEKLHYPSQCSQTLQDIQFFYGFVDYE